MPSVAHECALTVAGAELQHLMWSQWQSHGIITRVRKEAPEAQRLDTSSRRMHSWDLPTSGSLTWLSALWSFTVRFLVCTALANKELTQFPSHPATFNGSCHYLIVCACVSRTITEVSFCTWFSLKRWLIQSPQCWLSHCSLLLCSNFSERCSRWPAVPLPL